MALEVDTAEVTGGYRIIDTDRSVPYQGVALVVQRDAHPTIRDCEITHDEALARAKVMAAGPGLLEALNRIHASLEKTHVSGDVGRYVEDELEIARAAIRKATA